MLRIELVICVVFLGAVYGVFGLFFSVVLSGCLFELGGGAGFGVLGDLRCGCSWLCVGVLFSLGVEEAATMDKEVREMVARLKFSEEESKKIFSQNKLESNLQGWEAWAVGKLLTKKRFTKKLCIGSLGLSGILRSGLTLWRWGRVRSWSNLGL